MGRIPHAPFFYDAPRIFLLRQRRQSVLVHELRVRAILSFTPFAYLSFFSFFLIAIANARTSDTVRCQIRRTSHQFVPDRRRDGLSGMTRDRSCAIHTRHDDTCGDIFG